ncbi:MAG: hypothetical protein KKA32_02860, partial [Actinobacteria bacterium]|nr:hypothetical protein [Actinomycetota bacterium]
MRILAFMVILAGTLLLVSCAPVPTDSGITGLVTIGPISPVQREGEPADAPFSARIVIKRGGGGGGG